ncbi:MAG: RNA-guided endonuclease TnpB family protein, partial [Cyanobacteria bacterium J06573_2]
KIVIEDLNVSGMLSNGNLALSISDCGFYEFKRQLEYKSKKFGCQLIIADRWFASSKICSTCGHKHENLTLKDRVYECSNCGLEIDRDLNASLNLSKLAYSI